MSLLRAAAIKGLSRTILTGPRKRFVFLYHDISDPDSPQYSAEYSTPLQNFKSQIELLARHFKLVSLDEIVAGGSKSRQRVASITFDDGFLSVRDEAMPYLLARGIPFSVFVNSMAMQHNYLFNYAKGSDPRTYDTKVFLDESDIKRLSANGVTIGNHSATHRILAECDETTLREEVLDNRLYLERVTGTAVKHLALPFGKREHYNEQVLNFCYFAGHEYVYSTNPSFFEIEDRTRKRRLIPRLALLDESPQELYFLMNRPLLKKIDI